MGIKVTKNRAKEKISSGSAFILAVVLMSLLAIVGAMFVMASRLDRMSTSVISENKQLDFAVDTIVAQISDVLAQDSAGIGGAKTGYYDYPDANNPWLASLEPNESKMWRHISDVTGFLKQNNFGTQDVLVELPVPQRPEPYESFVREYPEIRVHDGNFLNIDGLPAMQGLWADADGDGVADSKWIVLPDVTSSKGKPIFAAIRVIDNGGMLNVNTGYKFDPNGSRARIDGSSQMQINLMALSWRPGVTDYEPAEETNLLEARAPNNLGAYESNVIWRYGEPNGPYTPFDISDELEFRYRFLLNHTDIDTRLEEWGGEFRKNTISTPVTSGGQELDTWFKRAYDKGSIDPNYAYRHIATTYNIDRIIDPNGDRMVNVNGGDGGELYGAVYSGLYDANYAGDSIRSAAAAQIAANIIDWRDGDLDVNTVYDAYGNPYYGFERPCVYISEVAHNFVKNRDPNSDIVYRSYAIELYKPYYEDDDPVGWQVVIDGNPIPIISWQRGSRRFYVIRFEDPNAPADPNVSSPLLTVAFTDVDEPNNPDDPNEPFYNPSDYIGDAYDANYGYHFNSGSTISLLRPVDGNFIVVDSVVVPDPCGSSGWLNVGVGERSIERDITPHRCIRRLWAGAGAAGPGTLGWRNDFIHPDPAMIQAHPANRPFINIGEIGMVLARSAYLDEPNDAIGPSDTEASVRIDLRNPVYQQVFNYLTVMDPVEHGCDPNEVRIKGRININTAPWYVIAQLPWVSKRMGYDSPALAKAIVEYREAEGGFKSVGELNNVVNLDPDDPNYSIDYYWRVDSAAGDRMSYPDLTPDDGAPDDFEERDLIFARISNLVTVRSDVFTAYILVRIGTDGPQKRAVAILDRSGVNSPGGKVKIVALQPVPDPR